MKLNSSSLLLAATTALLSASGSIAEPVGPHRAIITYNPKAAGCTDGSCWTSCLEKDGVPSPDPATPWEEGGDWCWLSHGVMADPDWTWISCEEDSDCSPIGTDCEPVLDYCRS